MTNGVRSGWLVLRWGWEPGVGAYGQVQFRLTPSGLRALADDLEREQREAAPQRPTFFLQADIDGEVQP